MRKRLNRTGIKELAPAPQRYEVADLDMPAFRLRVSPSGVKTFVLTYRTQDGRLRRYTIGRFGDVTPEAARKAAEAKLAEVTLGHDPQAQKQQARLDAERAKASSLRGFLDHKYGPWVEANRKSGAQTLAILRGRFAELLDKPMPEINAWIIERWRRDRLKAGIKPSTINRNLVALRACLGKAVEWGIIGQHPLVDFKLSKVDQHGRTRFLSDAEEQALRQALAERDTLLSNKRASHNAWLAERHLPGKPELDGYGDHLTPAVLISLNTGLRRGELLQLRWSDVDLSQGLITVRGTTAKSGKTRHVPLNREARAVIERWRQHPERGESYLFELKLPDGQPQPMENLKGSFNRVLKAAGIEQFSWHCLRHTFASRLVMSGVDLVTVGDLLGHADIKMTMRYSHLSPDHKLAAVERLSAAG